MSKAASNSVVVTILGKSYTLALEPGQTPEQVREIASLVDASMQEVQRTVRSTSPQQVAVLGALQLVDELFRLQSEHQAAESDIAQRSSRLSDSLGRVFQEVRGDSPGQER